MDAAHADGEELLRALDLLEAFYPVLLYLFTIGDVVVGTTLLMVPLCNIVAQQGFTVAGADENAARVGHLLIAWDSEETWRAGMHARPDGIGTQTEQQLEDGFIGLGAHSTKLVCLFVVLPCPVA